MKQNINSAKILISDYQWGKWSLTFLYNGCFKHITQGLWNYDSWFFWAWRIILWNRLSMSETKLEVCSYFFFPTKKQYKFKVPLEQVIYSLWKYGLLTRQMKMKGSLYWRAYIYWPPTKIGLRIWMWNGFSSSKA